MGQTSSEAIFLGAHLTRVTQVAGNIYRIERETIIPSCMGPLHPQKLT